MAYGVRKGGGSTRFEGFSVSVVAKVIWKEFAIGIWEGGGTIWTGHNRHEGNEGSGFRQKAEVDDRASAVGGEWKGHEERIGNVS